MTMWAAAAVVVATMGAAGGQGAPAVDPCTLIPRPDIEQIVGPIKGTPKGETVERAKMCGFTFASGAELEVWVFPASGLERAKSSLKDMKPLTDLGVEAHWRRNPDVDWIELYTKKGEVTIEVTMRSAPGDLDKVKALARKALGRL